MDMLLVQRIVRLEVMDVMMNVDVGMDGTRVGVYHADQCVGMGYGYMMKNVIRVLDVGMIVIAVMDGEGMGMVYARRCVGMDLLLDVRNVTAHLDVIQCIVYVRTTIH
jgi:hypothetical protein